MLDVINSDGEVIGYVDETPKTPAPKVFAAISKVMKDMKAVQKLGKQQGWGYQKIEDIYNGLQKELAKAELCCIPEFVDEKRKEIKSSKGNIGYHVVTTYKFHLFHSDGSTVCAIVNGESNDWGDKASANAHKQFLLKTFVIPTKDMEDTDKDPIVDILPLNEKIPDFSPLPDKGLTKNNPVSSEPASIANPNLKINAQLWKDFCTIGKNKGWTLIELTNAAQMLHGIENPKMMTRGQWFEIINLLKNKDKNELSIILLDAKANREMEEQA